MPVSTRSAISVDLVRACQSRKIKRGTLPLVTILQLSAAQAMTSDLETEFGPDHVIVREECFHVNYLYATRGSPASASSE
jgi:hypothetical protein